MISWAEAGSALTLARTRVACVISASQESSRLLSFYMRKPTLSRKQSKMICLRSDQG